MMVPNIRDEIISNELTNKANKLIEERVKLSEAYKEEHNKIVERNKVCVLILCLSIQMTANSNSMYFFFSEYPSSQCCRGVGHT